MHAHRTGVLTQARVTCTESVESQRRSQACHGCGQRRRSRCHRRHDLHRPPVARAAATKPEVAYQAQAAASASVCGRGARPSFSSRSSTASVVLITVSGVRLIESMPSRTRYSRDFGKVRRSLAADAGVPPIAPGAFDRELQELEHARVTLVEVECHHFRESRSTPSVSWVRSFEPMEKPSNSSANRSIRITLFGISHIT